MTCETYLPRQPTLIPVRRGYKQPIGIDWSCDLAEGETITSAETTVESAPEENATVLAAGDHTTNTTTTVTMRIDVPDDAPYGEYHLKRVTLLSTGRQVVECLSYLVEVC